MQSERLTRFPGPLRRMGGGLTISGGEPLVQMEFTRGLFRAAKEMRLHTALDTSGYLGDRCDDAYLDLVDLVLLDIKSGDPETYRRVTGKELEPTLRFADRLAAMAKPVWIRFVLVPGLTDILRTSRPLAASSPRCATSNGWRCCPSPDGRFQVECAASRLSARRTRRRRRRNRLGQRWRPCAAPAAGSASQRSDVPACYRSDWSAADPGSVPGGGS